MRKYLLISLLLHILILGGISYHQSKKGKDQGQQGSKAGTVDQTGNFIPKGIDVTVVEPKEIQESPVHVPKKESKGVKDCQQNQWYGGVGLKQDFISGVIEELGEGYPAQRAGLMLGDVVLRVSGNEIRGEPGSVVTIEVFRPTTNEDIVFNIVREKICVSKM